MPISQLETEKQNINVTERSHKLLGDVRLRGGLKVRYCSALSYFFVHYLDKLAHIQVVINYRYSIAQMCTCEDTLAHYLGAPSLDDVMSHNGLTTLALMF